MTAALKTMIIPVSDITRATSFYARLLGVQPFVNEPYYVAFHAGELHLGLNPNGASQGMTAPLAYWHVEDIRASLQTLLDAGATPEQSITDVGRGRLIASVKDADGNMIGLLQPEP